jgi:hypothetical protein
VDQHYSEGISGFSEVLAQRERAFRMDTSLFEAAIVCRVATQIEVNERCKVMSLGVVIVKFQGAEGSRERFARIALAHPRVSAKVVL